MAHDNIYQFINRYNINDEVRASYNSSITIINNTINNTFINYINEIYERDNYIIYYTNIVNDGIHSCSEEPISFTSDPKYIGEQCTICWDNVENLETMAVTKCRTKPHVFHKSCILSWTKKSSSCPNCRCTL
jgi:hypothetical protein